MRIYTINMEKKIELVKCNKCGKEIFTENGIIKEGAFFAETLWGYFSNKDGEKHSFDLCEKCYDELVDSFVIKPDVSEEYEMI